jgi:transposase
MNSVSKSSMKLSDVFQNLILARAQEVAAPSHTGRPRVLSDSQVTTLLFKLLRTGCQWRELECGKASFMAVYRRLQLWERKGVIESAYQKALDTYSKLRPPKRQLMDSSHVRNRHGRKPNTGRNHVDRGRQGTKVSVVTDDARIVYGMHLAPDWPASRIRDRPRARCPPPSPIWSPAFGRGERRRVDSMERGACRVMVRPRLLLSLDVHKRDQEQRLVVRLGDQQMRPAPSR